MDGATTQDQWRTDQAIRRTHLRHTMTVRQFCDLLLYFAALLCLFRGTQMAFGQPTGQDEFVVGRKWYQTGQLYMLMAMSCFYIAINFRGVVAAVRKASLLLWIVAVLIGLSVLGAASIATSAVSLFATVSMTLPPLLFYWRFGGEKALALFRLFSMATIAANLLYAVVSPHYAYMSGSLAGDLRGLFPHKNWFGSFAALMFVALVPTLGERPFLRSAIMIRAFFSLLAAYCLVAANSSTAQVQAAAGLVIIVGVSLLRRLPGYTGRSFATIAAFIGLIAMGFFGGMLIVSQVAESAGKDLTFSGRTYVWSALMKHAFDHPIAGFGYGTMRNTAYIEPLLTEVPFGVNSPHNSYIELLLSIGIPATVAWIIFVLARLHAKICQTARTPTEAMTLNRQAAILLMILIGSTTEAGRMLAPSITWPVMLLALPIWEGQSHQAR
jgi:exopolysaccharide production protein ExoQ